MNLVVYFVGKEFTFKGEKVKVVGETDTSNVKVKLPDGREVWTVASQLKAA